MLSVKNCGGSLAGVLNGTSSLSGTDHAPDECMHRSRGSRRHGRNNHCGEFAQATGPTYSYMVEKQQLCRERSLNRPGVLQVLDEEE